MKTNKIILNQWTDYLFKLNSQIVTEKKMLRDSILYLMKRKYHNHKVYLHNFSRFDSVFLLTVMTDLSNNIQPIMRDGNIINIKMDFAENIVYISSQPPL